VQRPRQNRAVELVMAFNNCYYVASWSNPLKSEGLIACGWEAKYRYNIQQVNPHSEEMPKKTVNIILKAGGYPTGFLPKGEFHRDSVNGHAWTNNVAVRAALLRSEILSYLLYVFSLTSVLSLTTTLEYMGI
jgi:hypothetical protein